ncbi:MAG: LytTR family DNA-binding domain-containing protein [Bacteroidota bacterium]
MKTSPAKRQVLILEDEELAATKMKADLEQYYQGQVAIEWLQSVGQGITYLRENTPDLILSDIELLDGRAFIIYEHIEINSPIIFTTAYDQYLLDAFRTNGIAYLLKPIDDEQLKAALDKYDKLFQQEQSFGLQSSVLEQLKEALDQKSTNYKQRFTIKKTSGIILLKVEDISHFQADNNIVFAFDRKGKKHIVSHKMSELEELLNPNAFFRLNRSEIVQVDFIEKIESYFNNRLAVSVPGIKKAMITSSSRTADFRKWIEEG